MLGSAQDLRRIEGDPVANAVARIAGGKAGAIYSQRMEFGPRALGARTILGSPADHRINDDLNRRLERSEFMPFAPVVRAERAREVFEVTDANAYACRFMTITCAVRPQWRERIPAVVHEEPIVDTPEQCRRALSDDRIDFVVTDGGLYERA